MSGVAVTGARSRIRGRLGFARSLEGAVGLCGTSIVLLIAALGPLLSPQSTTVPQGPPYAPPSGEFLLGTDQLGRDVLSRALSGGLRLIVITVLAIAVAYAIGAALGLFAGYNRGRADGIVMRILDVVLSFPPILLLLLLAAGAGAGLGTMVPGAILVNVPGIARIARSATLEVVSQPFVEAAVLRGERLRAILRREILPNISGALIADAGPRFSATLILIAGLNYLAIGVSPPTPDWGAMIFENRQGMTIQPWGVVAPAVLIIVLVLSANLLGEALARSRGRHVTEESPLA
jgi:peptide/nickel transport system permease protein